MGFSRNEFIAALLTWLTLCAPAFFTTPHKTVVDGKVVLQPFLFGHVIPEWAFMMLGVPLVALTWYVYQRTLDRIWPEPKPRPKPKHWPKPEVTDHEPRPTPRWTAREFLQSEAPTPLGTIMDNRPWEDEYDDFRQQTSEWLEQASEEELMSLLPLAREMGSPVDDEVFERLCAAYYERGIPNLDELEEWVEHHGHDSMRQDVREMRAERGDTA